MFAQPQAFIIPVKHTKVVYMYLSVTSGVRLLVGEAQSFFTHMFAKKLFKTINDKQIIVFIAIKPGLPNPWAIFGPRSCFV